MYAPGHPQKCHNACRTDPVRLVPRRRDHKVQRRAFFAPDTAVIAGNHVKLVVLRREVRVLDVANGLPGIGANDRAHAVTIALQRGIIELDVRQR